MTIPEQIIFGICIIVGLYWLIREGNQAIVMGNDEAHQKKWQDLLKTNHIGQITGVREALLIIECIPESTTAFKKEAILSLKQKLNSLEGNIDSGPELKFPRKK